MIKKVFFVVLLLACSFTQGYAMGRDYSVEEAHALIGDETIVWLDIREKGELEGLPKLDFARHLPLSRFKAGFSRLMLDQQSRIFVICRSGNRSKRLQKRLLNEGYINTVNILGGMRAWREKYPQN